MAPISRSRAESSRVTMPAPVFGAFERHHAAREAAVSAVRT
jgi:hypothetical protein